VYHHRVAKGPVASVVVCTHNRAAYIGRCLEGIAAQGVTFDYEVIVVDNCSTDGTARVAESFHDRLPLRVVREETLGLSHARNRGIREAKSDIIIYIDDDAVAFPGWLAEIVRCFDSIEPRPASVGGRVVLEWDGPAPSFIAECHYGIFGFIDTGDKLVRLDVDDATHPLFVGANMAFDRAALEDVGGFSPKFGYKGTKLLGGEETLVLRELVEQRRGVYYTPAAGVRHIVLPERRSRSYFARRMLSQGQSIIAIADEAGELAGRSKSVMFARDVAGLVRTGFRVGALSLQLRFREAELEGWNGVKRVGRIMMLAEKTFEPLQALRRK
jgi:glycosyltransferase involved in cell wall biosynthesis